MRKLVSLGGWCGPALILGKLGLRTEAYPFDFSRVTLDGVIHFVRHGFDEGFYPPGPPPYKPECVGIWVLFRGRHTAFAHFDLNDEKVKQGFKRKFERWEHMLATSAEPVTFFRTVTARNPKEELSRIGELERSISDRNPNLDFRIVVSVHDQNIKETTRLQPLSERVSLWALEYTEDESKTLFDRSQQGYATIVAHSLDEEHWKPAAAATHVPLCKTTGQALPNCLDTFHWRSHSNIALIDGIASVGATCDGIGSSEALPFVNSQGIITGFKCAKCGNEDMHRAGRPFQTERPFTAEEDELVLVHLYRILTGGDKVEAVEQLAHEMGRGAFEVICRIQHLTSSSTKITDV